MSVTPVVAREICLSIQQHALERIPKESQGQLRVSHVLLAIKQVKIPPEIMEMVFYREELPCNQVIKICQLYNIASLDQKGETTPELARFGESLRRIVLKFDRPTRTTVLIALNRFQGKVGMYDEISARFFEFSRTVTLPITYFSQSSSDEWARKVEDAISLFQKTILEKFLVSSIDELKMELERFINILWDTPLPSELKMGFFAEASIFFAELVTVMRGRSCDGTEEQKS